jgi:hypothetical protein
MVMKVFFLVLKFFLEEFYKNSMKKIKFSDDSILELRGDEDTFSSDSLEDKRENLKESDSVFKSVGNDDFSLAALKSTNMVRVRFDKFLTLLSKYDYEVALQKFFMQEIIVTTDLLADLASPPEQEILEEEPKKFPYFILIGGVLLGVIFTWLILK